VHSIGADRGLPLQADVSTKNGIAKVVDESAASFGNIDILNMANVGPFSLPQIQFPQPVGLQLLRKDLGR